MKLSNMIIIMFIALGVLSFASQQAYASIEDIQVWVEDAEGLPGDQNVTVPVMMSGATEQDKVGSVQFTLMYDAAVLQLENTDSAVSTDGCLTSNWIVAANTTVPGTLTVGMIGASHLVGSSCLAKLHFNVSEEAESGGHQLTFTQFMLNAQTPGVVNGEFRIVPQNSGPGIAYSSEKTTVVAGERLLLDIEAVDPEGDGIEIIEATNLDDFPAGTNRKGKTVRKFKAWPKDGWARFTWIPDPDMTPGVINLELLLRDAIGSESTPSIPITVLGKTTTTHFDFDGDGDVDGVDFGVFSSCYNGSDNEPRIGDYCSAEQAHQADQDNDGDVDNADYLAFKQEYSGAK